MRYETISVVVPCFNEGRTIYQNIRKINKYLSQKFDNFEIIVVNDGSTDNTLSQLKIIEQERPIKIIENQRNEGKGKRVREGILTSQNKIVMFLDADLAIPIEELGEFLSGIEKGADMVIASRFVRGAKAIKPIPWHRKIMEVGFRILRLIILNNWEIKDTQCGFKVFKREVAKRIFNLSTINRFAFEAEIIFLAKKFGYQIKELPITVQNPQKSHVRIFYDSIDMFFSLIKIKLNDLTRKYKQEYHG